MDKELVKELIQNEFNAQNLASELRKLMEPEIKSKMLSSYDELIVKLGGGGASQRVAELVCTADTE